MNRLVLDLETKRSFAEVGGAHNRTQLGVSLVGVYRYRDDRFIGYREEDFEDLAQELKQADQVVGFNLVGFDMPILARELGSWVSRVPTLDLMLEAQKALGHRISLNALAQATLGAGKLGSGLDALAYYREGDWEKLERYCLEDVKLTRDLFEYARKHGHLLAKKRYGPRAGNTLVPMSFAGSPFAAIFKHAQLNRSSVKMLYGGEERIIDVFSFDGAYIKAYCHSRKAERTFRLDRVEEAEAVPSSQPLF